MRTSTGLIRRPSIRWKDFNYSYAATFFVTICSFERRCTFSRIIDGRVELKRRGRVIDEELHRSVAMRPGMILDEYEVMPNHLHAIFFLPGGDEPKPQGLARSRRSLGSMIAGFKSKVTSRERDFYDDPHLKVWQKGYFDRVIRDGKELDEICAYIRSNPGKWRTDRYFTEA